MKEELQKKFLEMAAKLGLSESTIWNIKTDFEAWPDDKKEDKWETPKQDKQEDKSAWEDWESLQEKIMKWLPIQG